jgi:hypothetical protein
MGVTTKSHLAEDYSLEQEEVLDRISDMGEDFGEQNHQDQVKAERLLGYVQKFGTRETIKSKKEIQTKY